MVDPYINERFYLYFCKYMHQLHYYNTIISSLDHSVADRHKCIPTSGCRIGRLGAQGEMYAGHSLVYGSNKPLLSGLDKLIFEGSASKRVQVTFTKIFRGAAL